MEKMQARDHSTARAGRPSQGSTATTGTPSLLERTRLGPVRRATPDSEALASDDDEHDLSQSIHSLTSNPSTQQRPVRRESWLSEVQSGAQRRQSFNNSNVPGSPQPLTPSSDSNAWPFGSTLGRVPSNPASSPWTPGGIWGNDLRREPSARVVEGVSSPSNTFPSSHGRTLTEDKSSEAAAGEQTFPFSIPLHPTPKTYRSQSYSVGQMEAEAIAAQNQGTAATQARSRPGAPTNLMHRPSRPSMLSEVSEGKGMITLREEIDDNESNPGSDAGVLLSPGANASMDTPVNPLLRQAAFESARSRQRASTAGVKESHAPVYSRMSGPQTFIHLAGESAVEDDPDLSFDNDLARQSPELLGFALQSDGRRGQWHTQLGFGSFEEPPASRRHSLADLPTRRNSSTAPQGTGSDMFSSHANNASFQNAIGNGSPHDDAQNDQRNRNYAATYFSGVGPAMRSHLESSGPGAGMQPTLQGFRHGPAQGLFSRPGQDTKLYLVSFKCARAEVYYVAEGTGLEVKEGDLVMVEADRGHDLGTVLYAKVSWSRARELKEKAGEEHYRWLMMFSRHNQTAENGATSPSGMMASSTLVNPNANPPSGMGTAMFDASAGSDLKPKMIKRLAQGHEIATLRDKEGNEAKAKRICQQKAAEHKLNMEILDAEFQMDWKKLTFFYYADSYVNFNILVTDLFKIYKTRIWMSAVNPASLNVSALHSPTGMGPGAVEGRDSPMDARNGAFRTGLAQDPDPTGAIPPHKNPTTNAYHEYSLANRQPIYNQYSGGAQAGFGDTYLQQPSVQHSSPNPGFGPANGPSNNHRQSSPNSLAYSSAFTGGPFPQSQQSRNGLRFGEQQSRWQENIRPSHNFNQASRPMFPATTAFQPSAPTFTANYTASQYRASQDVGPIARPSMSSGSGIQTQPGVSADLGAGRYPVANGWFEKFSEMHLGDNNHSR